MSHRIEYQWGAFHVPARSTGLIESRYIIAVEGGDNNVCNAKTGKRARSWDACMIGTASQVLKQAVEIAAACEGGGLQPRGRYCTPEAYVRRIRRLMECGNYLENGWWTAYVQVAPSHAIVAETRGLGLPINARQQYGSERAFILFPPQSYADYFRLVDKYHLDIPAWYMAEVYGLPAS